MRITFWLKAFIPDSLHSSTGKEVTWRANLLDVFNEKDSISMLPLLTFFPTFSASYATDQRSFSFEINASARITTVIDIPCDENEKIACKRYSDPTLQIYHPWKNFMPFSDADIQSLTSEPKGQQSNFRTDNTISLSFSTSGSNPFFTLR